MSITNHPLSKSTIRQQRLRRENIEALGGRCSNPDCRWHNEDGTVGCTNHKALQFDHRNGGGSVARRAGRDAGLAGLYYIKNHPGLFQLLCANCNWIKRGRDDEARGAFQHSQAARLRRSLQVHGQPVRRVKISREAKIRKEELEFLAAERSFLAAKQRDETERRVGK